MTEASDRDPLTRIFAQAPPETPADMRRMIDGFAGLMNADLPEVGALHESVPIGDGVTADVVVPKGDGPHPVLVYLHGGGWICGSPKTHRKLAHRFAEAGTLVVNVDYRLAPEHPFPKPFEDCVEALRWTRSEVGRFGGDPDRIAVGGDSAGGNLSAAAASHLVDEPARPKAALLIYGVFDFARIGEVPDPMPAVGPLAEMGEKMVELMVGSYLGNDREQLLPDPRVSPIHVADALPPTHVVVGSADPLVAQAEALAERLAASGVAHEHYVDAGMPHGYAQMEFLAPTRPAIERMVSFLRKHL
jgi:acetyl esterase